MGLMMMMKMLAHARCDGIPIAHPPPRFHESDERPGDEIKSKLKSMDMITNALEVCVKIYTMHGTYKSYRKSNQDSRTWISERVHIIQQTLQKQQDVKAIPDDCILMLQCLKEDLRACNNVLLKYGFQNKFTRFFRGKKHEDRFTETGKRLFHTFDIFCHTLSIQRSANA